MIEKLDLSKFKNFAHASLSLGKLSLLVGANASGKSNLRDAFRFVHGMARGYKLAEIIGEKYIEGGVLQWAGIRGSTKEVAFFGENTFQLQTTVVTKPTAPPFRHTIGVELDPHSTPRVIKESLMFGKRMVFDSHPERHPPEQEGVPYLWVRIGKDKNRQGEGINVRFADKQPVLTQLSGNRIVSREIKALAEELIAELASMRFLDLSPDAMRRPSLPGQVVLGDRGENLSSILQAICETKQRKRSILQWIKQLTPVDVADFEFVPDQTGRVLVSLIEEDGKRTSAYSASDGTLRFLAMIAAMLGPDPARFYFFKELNNGIHPTRLHLLLQLIEQSVAQGTIQVVSTTHSPQLLGFLSDEAREAASLVYRLPGRSDAGIRRIMTIPEASRLLKSRSLGRLQESGWLENAVEFVEDGRDGQEVSA